MNDNIPVNASFKLPASKPKTAKPWPHGHHKFASERQGWGLLRIFVTVEFSRHPCKGHIRASAALDPQWRCDLELSRSMRLKKLRI